MSVYNGARYLRESVESILSQKGVDLEFIIVNDGSTDNSAALLEEYREYDPRVRLFSRENQGLTSALIFGCGKARAEFIARQDADDISSPDRLQKLHSLLTHQPAVALASSWVSYIGPNEEDLGLARRPADPLEATHRLFNEKEGPPAHGSVMFRKTIYEKSGGYRPEFYYGQDSDLWLRMGAQGLIAYILEPLYKYRYTLNSISVARSDIQKQFGKLGQLCLQARNLNEPEGPWIDCAAELSQLVRTDSVTRLPENQRLANASYFMASNLYERRNPAARLYFEEAIKANPFHWRARVKLALAVISQKVKHGKSQKNED